MHAHSRRLGIRPGFAAAMSLHACLQLYCAACCRKFADGFPDLFVEDALDIRNKHVAFLGSFHNPAVIFEQVHTQLLVQPCSCAGSPATFMS